MIKRLMMAIISILLVIGITYYIKQEKTVIIEEEITVSDEEQYINSVKEIAQEVGKANDLYPSIMIAQSIVESSWGKSILASKYNNYFGIKGEKNGKSIYLETREVINGTEMKINGKFRVYTDKKESFEDNALVLKTEQLGEEYLYEKSWRSNGTVEEAVKNLSSHYATDENYGIMLVQIIKDYNLEQYD